MFSNNGLYRNLFSFRVVTFYEIFCHSTLWENCNRIFGFSNLFFKCKQMAEFYKKLINDLFIVKWRNASEGKNCARAKNKLIEKRQLSNTKRTVHPTLFLEFIKKSVEVIRFLQKEQNKSMWPVLLLCRRHFQPVQKLKVYT